MRHILVLCMSLLILAGCADKNQMNLSGNIEGLKRGTILLQKIVDTTVVSIDSMGVDETSSFQFTDVVDSPEQYFLYIRQDGDDLKDVRLPFFADAGEITIESSVENFVLDAKITGSKNQDLYEEFKRIAARYNDRNLDLIEEAFNAQLEGNDSLVEASTRKQRSNIKSKYLATVNFAINHNDAELAPYLALSEIFDANVTYLDTIYGSLTPRIKDSKYGKALEEYIAGRKDSL